ncbi:FAD-binding protein [Arthrobacter sp. ISL-72]|nr:FAD-binding protein [Arthrobacter sp. ISL-72]
MSKTVCDVLVIGSGVAGMAAALKAASQGLTVIVRKRSSILAEPPPFPPAGRGSRATSRVWRRAIPGRKPRPT